MNECDLFIAAMNLDGEAERAAYLDNVCAGDINLRLRVDALIGAHFHAGSFLEQPATTQATAAHTPSADKRLPATSVPTIGSTIGPYKLREILGEGGMGSVFVAEQEKPVRRKVALKVIKLGMDSREVISRFEAERQALALMDHPNIAHVLDAGVTNGGRPFFVMELIKGLSITEHSDLNKLNNRDRLELFVQVCRAIHHAHQKGIIHRDLKPSNVLVAMHDTIPVVKVIDFGVAKAIGQQLTEKTLYTGLSQMVGTPLYMSPEQAGYSSIDVDTRSDVYSLGVLLYELLTGSTPFDRDTLQKSGFDEMRRLILEVDPPRPSQRVDTLQAKAATTVCTQRSIDKRTLSHSLSGELDWIVMKAIEKQRDRRYDSPKAFAEDILRFLNNDRVQACPPSTMYRTSKFIRRNKTWLTAAACFALALVIGIGVVSWQAVRAVAAEELAVAERANAERNLETAMDAIEQLLVHVGNPELANVPALQSIRKKILQSSIDFYERFSKQSGRKERIEYRAARVFKELGKLSKAIQQMPESVEAYTKAFNLIDSLVRQSPRRIDYLELQAELNGLLSRLYEHRMSGETSYDKAIAHAKLAEQQYNTLSQWEPGKKNDLLLRAESLSLLAQMYFQKNPTDPRVAEIAEQALQLTKRSSAIPRLLYLLALMNRQANPKLAETYFSQALVAVREQSHDDHEVRFYHSWICNDAGNFYATRNASEAELLWKEAIEIMIDVRQGYPEFEDYSYHFGKVVSRYVRLLDETGRSAEVLPQLDEWLKRSAVFHSFRASWLAKNNSDLAIGSLTDAIAEFPGEYSYWMERGGLYASQDANDEALANFNRAIELYPTESVSLYQSSKLYLRRGDLFESMKQYSKAIDDYDRYLEHYSRHSHVYNRRALAYFYLREFDKCLADVKQSIKYSPTDLSNLTWIPTSQIIACGDESFRDDFLKLVDEVVEVNRRTSEALITSAAIHFEFERWDEARNEIAEAIKDVNAPAYLLYQAGLLLLTKDEIKDYQSICQRLLRDFRSSDDATTLHFAAWTCSLAADVIDEYVPAIELARKAVEKVSSDQQKLTGVGAILMRSRQYLEAKTELKKAIALSSSANSSECYPRYFLAMTEHHLGNADAALTQLKLANESADKEMVESVAWNRKLTIMLLRTEARKLIGDSGK